MSTTQSLGVERRFRGRAIPRATPLVSPSRRRMLVLIGAMLALAGVAVGIASLLRPAPQPKFLGLWISSHPADWTMRETVAANDQRAIHDGGYFSQSCGRPTSGDSRRSLSGQLGQLPQCTRSDSLVMYLAARADIDAQGNLGVVVAGTQSQELLPLREVLTALRDCPAGRKFVILDLAPPASSVPWSTTQDDVTRGVMAELSNVRDPKRLTLCACSLGESPLDCEALGRSGLGYFFEEALTGAADGWLDGRCDGRVSALETAQFVQLHVARWSLATHGLSQTPRMLGSGQDFDLIAVAVGDRPSKRPAGLIDGKREYPKWLMAAWNERKQLRRQRAYTLTPRLFRRWEQTLLRAEQQWRGGRAVDDIQRDVEQQLAPFRSEFHQTQALLGQVQPYSLGLLQQQEPISDLPAARQAVGQLLADIQGKTHALPADQAESVRQSLLQQFAVKCEKISDLAVVAAAMDELEQCNDPSPAQMVLWNRIARLRQPQPLFTETLLLSRLADLAGMPNEPWRSDVVACVVRAAQRQATSAPPSPAFGWTEQYLSAAAQHDHNGQYVLLRPGYAPSQDAAAELQAAEFDYQRVGAANETIIAAYQLLDEALLRLPEYCPWSSDFDSPNGIWLDAIDAACRLADMLELVDGRPKRAGDNLACDVDTLTMQTESLAGWMAQLRRNIDDDHIAQLVSNANSTRAEPSTATEIDKILQWPGLTAAQRQELIAAKRTVDQNLYHGFAAQRISRTDETPRPSPRASEGNHVARTLALLRLGGLEEQSLRELKLELAKKETQSKAATSAETLGDRIDLLIQSQGPQATPWARARLGSIVPAEPVVRWLDTPSTNPNLALRREVIQHRNRWLADYFLYRAHDDTPVLFADIARRYGASVGEVNDVYLRFDGVQQLPRPSAAQPHVDAQLRWQLVGGDMDELPAATYRVLQSDGELLLHTSVTAARDGTSATLSLESNGSPAGQGDVDSRGVLWAVTAAGRVWHWPMTFQPQPWGSSLQILFSTAASLPGEVNSALRFRPSAAPQELYLSVANPTDHVANVTVEISGVGTMPLSVPPQATTPVAFKPQPTQASDEVDLLVVRLHDTASGELLREVAYPLEILSPSQYVRVAESRFLPGENGDNQLTVTLQADAMPPGPPCIVELELSGQTIPGLVAVTGGTLRGVLPADGRPLVLSASGLQLIDGASEQAEFSLTVDGVPRAITFAADLARRGDPTTPRQVARPSISLVADGYALAGPGFQVTTPVVQGPASASIQLRAGRMTEAGFVTELHKTAASPRRHRVRVEGAKDGGLAFNATLEDWVFDLDASGIVGPRIVMAEMVGLHGQPLARAQETVVFDNSPPERAYFVAAPAEVLIGKPIDLQIAGADAVSGIEKVFVFAGAPVDDKPPTDAKLIAAVRSADGLCWNAEIPPMQIVGTVQLTAQVVNRVGLASYVSTPVRIVDEISQPGCTLHGVVREGELAQPYLAVVLYSGSGVVLATTNTNAAGAYTFNDLKPGAYRVSSAKEASGRKAQQAVSISAGQTLTADLDLAL